MSSPLSLLPSLDTEVLERLVLSTGAILVIGAVRIAAERVWARGAKGAERHRRRVGLRLTANAVLALVLLALWISQLQTLVLSLAAVLVALVIATKELIMCAAGAVLRVGGHLFRVGDRIAVRGLHGEVVDHGLFSTTLVELPPAGGGHRATGRTFVLPNSAFLTETVRVEAGPRRYAPHRFALTLDRPVSASEALDALRDLAVQACAHDRERAARFHSLAASRTGLEEDGPAPAVRVKTSDLGKLVFDVSIYCLVEEAETVEARVTIPWLDRFAMPAEVREPAGDARPDAASIARVDSAIDAELEERLRELARTGGRMRRAAQSQKAA